MRSLCAATRRGDVAAGFSQADPSDSMLALGFDKTRSHSTSPAKRSLGGFTILNCTISKYNMLDSSYEKCFLMCKVYEAIPAPRVSNLRTARAGPLSFRRTAWVSAPVRQKGHASREETNVRQLLFSAVVAGALLSGGTAHAACGDISLAVFTWQSAEAMSNVDQFILSHGYGCNVTTVAGDTVPTITAMIEKEQPDISSESTPSLLGDVYTKGAAEGRI